MTRQDALNVMCKTRDVLCGAPTVTTLYDYTRAFALRLGCGTSTPTSAGISGSAGIYGSTNIHGPPVCTSLLGYVRHLFPPTNRKNVHYATVVV
jgi:hypothetical protein